MQDKLEELFSLLCDDFKNMLESGEMTASDRKCLIDFLKENGINVVGMKNQNVRSIVDSLPFDENVESDRAINQ